MASIICKVSAQFTQNIFLRLDKNQYGYLDQNTLERALVGLSQYEIKQLLLALDQDGHQRIYPHALHLAILDWLSEPSTLPISTSFASLIVLYGLDDEVNLQAASGSRRHITSDHSLLQTGYAR